MQPTGTAFDRTLLDGFDFACRPGCALCCYGSPAVSAVEAHQLLSIRPETELLPASQGFEQLPCRPDGGACVFLASEQCTVREARPFPCRSFPVGVHIGARLQASLVLGCPGVNVEPLADWPNATST
ncbi:MAG: YkgJ family cysteine cluster protein, partial [Thermoplasmata archaeon]|nr:YkgJ family cysteine cluster protein [Thermoplasmata archaeon]